MGNPPCHGLEAGLREVNGRGHAEPQGGGAGEKAETDFIAGDVVRLDSGRGDGEDGGFIGKLVRVEGEHDLRRIADGDGRGFGFRERAGENEAVLGREIE